MKAKRTEHAILGKSEALYISVYDNRDLGELYWGADEVLIGYMRGSEWRDMILSGTHAFTDPIRSWDNDYYKFRRSQ